MERLILVNMKFIFLNGSIGAFLFYYFVRKIQTYYNVDPSIDPWGMMGAAYYGLFLGFIFGIKFVDSKKIISYFKKKK